MDGASTQRSHRKRRRQAAGDPLRKVGWQVPQSVAEAVREAVEMGAADSQNALVERALVRELNELRRQRVYSAYAQAAADPVFRQDMSEVASAFEQTAGDGLSRGEGLSRGKA